jgi:hypothetical protein
LITTDVVVDGNSVVVVAASVVVLVLDVDDGSVVVDVVVVDVGGSVVGSDVSMAATVVLAPAAVAGVSFWDVTAPTSMTSVAPTRQISSRRLTIDVLFSLFFREIGVTESP